MTLGQSLLKYGVYNQLRFLYGIVNCFLKTTLFFLEDSQ